MGCVYLKSFHKWSKACPFPNWSGDSILHQVRLSSLHKRSWKKANKGILLPMMPDNDEV